MGRGRFYLKVFTDREHLWDVSLPRWVMWVVGGVVAVSLALGGVGIGGVIYGASLKLKAQRAEAECQRLRAENAKLQDAREKLDLAIAKEREIRTILGLEQKPVGYDLLPRGGYIDTEDPELWQLERLVAVAQQEAEDLSGIEKELGARIAEQRNMPSIAPAAGVFTSGFGYRRDPVYGGWRFHSGLDIAAPRGTPIVATADGVVVSAGWHHGYGLAVELSHGHGITTYYAHCSRIAVSPGMKVKRGQVIAYMGATGKTTGPHVHYEVRVKGKPKNPEKYILLSSELEYD